MIKLRPDQLKDVRQMHHFHGRVLLANQMRLGKTIVTLQWLVERPDVRPAIVVSPEIGKWHWEEQALQHFNIRGAILEGMTPPKKPPANIRPLYFLNFDILPSWVHYLRRLKAKALIIDECHWIKNPRALCSKAMRNIIKGRSPFTFPYIKENGKKLKGMCIIAIGGTPLKSRPYELFNVLNLVRPDKYNSRFNYGFRYCKPSRKPWGWEFKGAKNIGELNHNLQRWCMIRHLRKDVVDEPEKERYIVPIKIKDRHEYSEAENNFIRWLSKRSSSRAKKARKAKRLVQMGYLKRLASSLKMKGVFRWIDNFLEENDGKLAVFGIHKNILRPMYERYKSISVIVDGSIRGRKRKAAVKTFQRNKKCRLFIGNTTAAGTVIELSKASAMAAVEMDWTPGEMTQVEDRIYEEGEKAIIVYYLVAKNTIEEKLCKILQSKQDVLSKVLDGGKGKNRLNVFDLLEKELKKKGNIL